MRRVLLAMSGGVDSSTAALLLKDQGYDLVGCTMQLWDQSRNGSGALKRCCSLEDVYDARRIAECLGFPYYVLNLQSEFRRQVIQPFISSYLSGRTPLPCTTCNTSLKFDTLLQYARKLGIDLVATGHYARVQFDPDEGFLLYKGRDVQKDQSYYLFELTQAQLSHSLFPVGNFEKPAIRNIARRSGLPTAAKRESQEICFVRDGDYPKFIRHHAGDTDPAFLPVLQRYDRLGRILFKDGTELGTHEGIYHFTVGQRRGLGISHSKPLYVLRLDVEENTVIVGYKEDAYCRGLVAEGVNWITRRIPLNSLEARVRIRANHVESLAQIRVLAEESKIEVIFRTPQLAVTPGQAAVIYQEDRVLGGGWILSTIPQ